MSSSLLGRVRGSIGHLRAVTRHFSGVNSGPSPIPISVGGSVHSTLDCVDAHVSSGIGVCARLASKPIPILVGSSLFT